MSPPTPTPSHRQSIRDVCTSLSEKTPSLYSVPSEPACLLSSPFVWTLCSIMSVTACQGLGFVVSLIGFAGIIAATCMDQWSTQDLYNNPVTAVFNYQGLWRSCVRESSGFTECRGYFTLLGLPGKKTIGWLGVAKGQQPLPETPREGPKSK